jgi:hypothetical protein
MRTSKWWGDAAVLQNRDGCIERLDKRPLRVDVSAGLFKAIYDRAARGGERVVEFIGGIAIRDLEDHRRSADCLSAEMSRHLAPLPPLHKGLNHKNLEFATQWLHHAVTLRRPKRIDGGSGRAGRVVVYLSGTPIANRLTLTLYPLGHTPGHSAQASETAAEQPFS